MQYNLTEFSLFSNSETGPWEQERIIELQAQIKLYSDPTNDPKIIQLEKRKKN